MIILFLIYEFWTFKNKKSLKYKLSPLVILVLISIFVLVFASFFKFIGYYFIFFILALELSLIGIILVCIFEIFLMIVSHELNLKKLTVLLFMSIALALIYYLGQKAF
ncbi:hypothetical protein A500_11624 [Clostridium sartagoforme AAU1]|uniref:Uncharacterized protein n=1 Tax=Clostridium sartagoforme AAU1 TaxID=1202534 RepID=R9CCI3_9CLOT|nr:hypothetical protein A500_11624 [Clostridium sartagoforme AAU1]